MSLVVIAFLVLVEIALHIAAAYGVIVVEHYRTTAPTRFSHEKNPDIGRWHHANRVFEDRMPCATARYRSDSHGMRDRERNIAAAENRIVVLGDSFVEGLGVSDGERMTDDLESFMRAAHRNFGVTGARSVMEWVLYRSFAKRFSHDRLYLFVVPNNFDDINPRKEDINGYRPYLRQVSGGRRNQGARSYGTFPRIRGTQQA